MRFVFGLSLAICLLAQDGPAPQDSQGWLNKGIHAYKSGKYQEATDAFQKGRRFESEWSEPSLYLGTVWMSHASRERCLLKTPVWRIERKRSS